MSMDPLMNDRKDNNMKGQITSGPQNGSVFQSDSFINQGKKKRIYRTAIWSILAVLALFLVIAGSVLFVRIVRNHQFVTAYAKEEYLVEKEESLLKYNIPEGYLPYYNLGNVAFENGDYNSAVGYYTKALTLFPTGQKECDIRVNLALAMCYTIDFENITTQEARDSALIILYKARDILLENNWATEDGEGHRDDDAQQLKEDIDYLIKLLQNQDDNNSDNQDDDKQNQNQGNQDQDDSDNNSDGPSGREKKQKEKLDKNKKNALEERKQQQDTLERWGYGSGGSEDDGDSIGSGQGNGATKPW